MELSAKRRAFWKNQRPFLEKQPLKFSKHAPF